MGSHPRSISSRALIGMFALALALAMVPAAPVVALLGDTFWVDPYFGSDATGTGSSAAPFKTITHAMTHAGAWDDIVLRDGVYSLTSGEALPIAVDPGVTVRAEHRRGAYIDGEDEVSVFDMLDPGPHTGLSGLVIMNGYGGTGAGLKIRRYATSGPGDAGWPRILDCWFYRCTGATAGGGIYTIQTEPAAIVTPLVEACTFTENEAVAGAAIAMQAQGGAITVRNCDFVRNGTAATAEGGGIHVGTFSDAVVVGNTFRGNTAVLGAALFADQCEPIGLSDNTFVDNVVVSGGKAAVYLRRPTTAMTFERNRVVGTSGGRVSGLYLAQGTFNSVNNVVAANTTAEIGGVAGVLIDTAASVSSDNDAVCNNTASGTSGWDGIDVLAGSLAMTDGIAWHVPRVIGSPVSSSQDVRGPATLAYTTTRDTDLTGTGIRHSNPLIVGAGPVGYDARPKYRSPAIDSGTEAAATPATDIRGVGRPLDSDLVAGSAHDRGAYEIRPPALRTYSATRYGQAWGVALRTYPGFAGVTDVVIACGDDRAAADPLAAAGLCWTYDAPLLLTSATTLTIETRSAFTMLATLPHVAPLRVHVVGGTGSVPQARLDDIAAIVGPSAVSFDRITAVGDRYDLAAAIARRMNDEGPTPSKHVALIANGADPVKFFDALALSPIARAQGCPILLVKYGSVPAATASALNGLGLNQRYMAGGPGTILESVRVSLGATRWWGADRYSTAVAVANGAKSKGWSSFATVGVAGGKTGLYDALAGGTMVGRDGGVLLLTTPAALSATTGNTLTANRSAISECLVFGTVGAVSEATRLAVRNKVR